MKNYNDVSYDINTNILTIEPCQKIEDIYLYLDKYGVTLPGGECAGVNIGGHVQTGGFGKLTHSFGLLCDYVLSFKIVIPKPAEPVPIPTPRPANTVNIATATATTAANDETKVALEQVHVEECETKENEGSNDTSFNVSDWQNFETIEAKGLLSGY